MLWNRWLSPIVLWLSKARLSGGGIHNQGTLVFNGGTITGRKLQGKPTIKDVYINNGKKLVIK